VDLSAESKRHLLEVVLEEREDVVEGDAVVGESGDKDSALLDELLAGFAELRHRLRRVATDSADDAAFRIFERTVDLDDLEQGVDISKRLSRHYSSGVLKPN